MRSYTKHVFAIQHDKHGGDADANYTQRVYFNVYDGKMQLCDGNLDVSAHDSLNSPGTVTSHEAISDVMMPDTCSHHVMNAAARVIMNLSLRDHVKPALKQLHWLPVELRIITYKPCLFMYHIHTGQAPQYLSDCVSAVSALSGRYRLRSTGSIHPIQLGYEQLL